MKNNIKKRVEELERPTIEQFKKIEKLPLVVVLDDVRSMNNVGSVFRTSDAFLVERVCLCGITAVPPHPDIHKTALGAEDSVEWSYYEDVCQAIDEFKGKGYKICAVEQAKESLTLDEFLTTEIASVVEGDDKLRGYVVILGNEVKGVSQRAIDVSDKCIELPQYGTKHSLNVSVTAGIVIYNLFSLLSTLKEYSTGKK